MQPDSYEFLDGLFRRCDVSKQPLFLTLSIIHPDGEHPTPSRHIPLQNKSALMHALDRIAVANAAGWGAYFGVAPRRPGLGRWNRGSKTDLVALPALFIDIDHPDKDTVSKLQRFALPPSYIVESGCGLHTYFLLNQPSTAFFACEQAMRGLAQIFEGDSHSSAAHSMRLVGTTNTKPQVNALCKVVDYRPHAVYDLGEFFKYIPPAVVEPTIHRGPICLPNTGERLSRERIQKAKEAIASKLISLLNGRRKANGFWACLCPYGHCHDRPGMHFNWSEQNNGYCFGKHKGIPFLEMCNLMGVIP